MLDLIFTIFLLTCLTELFLYPRLDLAGGKLLFWYGIRTRTFLVLWDFNK